MSLNRLFEDDYGFFMGWKELIAKRSFNIEYVCGLVYDRAGLFQILSTA